MNCPNCGSEVQGNFCTNCGTRLDQVPPSRFPGEGAAGDAGATSVIRPGDLQGVRAQEPPPGQGPSGPPPQGPPGQQPYAPPPQGVPGGQQPYGQPPPQGMPAGGGPQPYGAPGPGQPPYGGAGPGQPPGGPPPSGSNWARELGINQPPPGGPTGGPGGFPGGFKIPVPPGVQNALAPLEQFGKQIVAWAGCVVLLVGLFVSAKTYSYSGGVIFSFSASRSMWDYATFWSVILILLIIASAGLAFIRDYNWLLITGAASLVILILNFLYTFSTGVSLSGYSAHPSWGWILLFPGALLILAAGAMRPTPRDAQDDYGLMKLIGQARSQTGSR